MFCLRASCQVAEVGNLQLIIGAGVPGAGSECKYWRPISSELSRLGAPGADAAGYAGLEDEVDNHWGELLKAAALSTLLAVGTELGAGSDTNSNDSAIIQALRHGAGDSLNQTGQQVVRRSLNIQPTLTIRPGFPVRVIVNRDLVLEPYRG